MWSYRVSPLDGWPVGYYLALCRIFPYLHAIRNISCDQPKDRDAVVQVLMWTREWPEAVLIPTRIWHACSFESMLMVRQRDYPAVNALIAKCILIVLRLLYRVKLRT